MCGTITASEAIDKIKEFVMKNKDNLLDDETTLMLISEAIEAAK